MAWHASHHHHHHLQVERKFRRMLTRLPGQILVASHNGQHWSGLNFEDICSKGMILLFGDNFCTFSNVKMSIVSKRCLWLRMFVQRYLVWDIKHLIEEAACEINVDMGMDGPVECPPTPCWMPLAPPWVAPPCLLLPKQLNFMQIQPPPLGINPLLWAQSANTYIHTQ